MDVVYICRDGENEELRYSIRSVVKNLKHDNIWVVGGKPDWYTGNHIPVTQSASKYENARENMRTIASSEEISDDFVLMNDDFFILKPVAKIKYYHGGYLFSRIRYLQKKYGSSSYLTMLNKTYRYLKSIGIKKPLDYALHIPFVMNKEKLSNIIDLEISWRIAYGNIFGVGGIEVENELGSIRDVKFYLQGDDLIAPGENTISDKFLSTEDKSFERLQPMLDKKFSKQSIYEVSPVGLEPTLN